MVVEIEQSDDEDGDEDWDEEAAVLFPSRAAIRRKAAEQAAKEERAAKRVKKALPTFLSGSNISGEPGGGSGGGGSAVGAGGEWDEDDGDSSDETAPNGKSGDDTAAAHARRLGVANVTSLEERDEMKKKLLPWTEHMKQVWRRQQAELEDASGSGEDGGSDPWWKHEDGDAAPNSGGGRRRSLGGRLGPGVMFRVGGRYVTMDAVTNEDAAKMSPDEYTRFYNLAVSQRG